MTEPQPNRYYAYADGLGRGHGHVVEAGSYEAAAIGYTEIYSPPTDSDGDVKIIVASLDEGLEHCFTVDLSEGGASSCD